MRLPLRLIAARAYKVGQPENGCSRWLRLACKPCTGERGFQAAFCCVGLGAFAGKDKAGAHAVALVLQRQPAAVQTHDFGNEAQPQAAAAPAVGAGERVEALRDFGEGVVGDGVALVVDVQCGGGKDDADGGVRGGEV